MLKYLGKKMKNNKGFTLIELIVVIAILGILAAVAVPKLSGLQGTAKAKVAISNEKMINNLIALYNAEKGSYPDSTDFADLLSDLQSANYLDSEVASDLAEANKADSWNNSTPSYTSGSSKITLTPAAD